MRVGNPWNNHCSTQGPMQLPSRWITFCGLEIRSRRVVPGITTTAKSERPRKSNLPFTLVLGISITGQLALRLASTFRHFSELRAMRRKRAEILEEAADNQVA